MKKSKTAKKKKSKKLRPIKNKSTEKIEEIPPSSRGKIKEKSTVAFSFSPAPKLIADSEFSLFAKKIETAFYSFLKEEAKKDHKGVMFGGIAWKEDEGAYLLCSAFSPFEDRKFIPRARIRTDENGAIRSIESAIKKEKPKKKKAE